MPSLLDIAFYALAAWSLFAAAAAITRRSPLAGALWLVGCLIGIAALYAVLTAPLVAMLSLLIAAGAVMVLIIFVLMLIDLGPGARRPRRITFARIVGALAAAYLALVMSLSVARPPFASPPESGAFFQSPLTLGRILMDRYLLPFELAGFMLLAAAVALVTIAGRRDVLEAEEVAAEEEVTEKEELPAIEPIGEGMDS